MVVSNMTSSFHLNLHPNQPLDISVKFLDNLTSNLETQDQAMSRSSQLCYRSALEDSNLLHGVKIASATFELEQELKATCLHSKSKL